ncbi:hypothetical protein BN1183_AC_00710 [Pantoea ananatis]|nr:hypothetical protein BN1183_AC_00710 [Pantoea ananatis]
MTSRSVRRSKRLPFAGCPLAMTGFQGRQGRYRTIPLQQFLRLNYVN